MLSNKYQFALIDWSWLASRSQFVISAGKHAGDYVAGEVIRLCFQTVAKLTNQLGVTFDKAIFIHDKWDPNYNGYYRHYLLNGEYKDSREYIDELAVERKRAEGASEEEIKKLEDEAYFNRVRMNAKYTVMRDLTIIPSLYVSGLECDDIMGIFANLYTSDDPSKKPSVLISKDSDFKRFLLPGVDFFKFPKKGEEAHIWTYQEALEEVPQNLRDAGLSLYWYHCLEEALGSGHNDVKSPRKSHTRVDKVIEDIVLRNDYSDIEDMDMFKRQMNSFDLSTFPMYQEAVDMITSKFMTIGRIPTITEFRQFCNKNEIGDSISDRYFSTFAAKLDRSMYQDPAPENSSPYLGL